MGGVGVRGGEGHGVTGRDVSMRLAIGNRGEAALRCIRAVKALRAAEGSDLRAIALYTPVDRDAPFVRHADIAVLLPTEEGREVAAYLDHDGIISALLDSGADAVWPGWGLVAEDPVLVGRLESAGIRFRGPSPDAPRPCGRASGGRSVSAPRSTPCSRAASFVRLRPSLSSSNWSPYGPTRIIASIRRIGPRSWLSFALACSGVTAGQPVSGPTIAASMPPSIRSSTCSQVAPFSRAPSSHRICQCGRSDEIGRAHV